MASTEDERPVETLRPDGFDHPFRVGIGVGRPDRSQDHLCPLGAEDLVEWPDELGVAVADEEPDGGRAIIEFHRQVAGLLGDPEAESTMRPLTVVVSGVCAERTIE